MWRTLTGWLAGLACLAIAWGGWQTYQQRHLVDAYLRCYEIGQLDRYDDFRREVAALEQRPVPPAHLVLLVEKWGSGNDLFDTYLCQYLAEPSCSDDLRAAFTRHIGRQPELLKRYAHHWCYHQPDYPAGALEGLAEYLQTLAEASSDEPPPLAWRDVLDVQVLFTATGHPRLAHRLTPENWPDRHQRWVAQHGHVRHFWEIQRPAKPWPPQASSSLAAVWPR